MEEIQDVTEEIYHQPLTMFANMVLKLKVIIHTKQLIKNANMTRAKLFSPQTAIKWLHQTLLIKWPLL